jgi:inner membrane protein
MSSEKKPFTIKTITNSLPFRIMIIGILILVLLIPAAMISSLIRERKQRRNEVVEEISSKWAYSQTLIGPILEIPYYHYYKSTYKDDDGKWHEKTQVEVRLAYFLPEDLDIDGSLVPEIRYRGMYQAVVYTADLAVTGSFNRPDFSKLNIQERNVIWDDSRLVFGISDMRGINKSITINWNGSSIVPEPGVRNKQVISQGANAIVRPDLVESNIFSMQLNMRGSEIIHFLPLGRETNISLQSKWESPSFTGLFLPKNRELGDNGFSAEWQIFDYNREFPQQWTEEEWNVYTARFGVELFTPVDEYHKIERTTKYAVLFIVLTFLAFFLIIELFNKKRIHPIQYLLVGFSLSMFYLLLLSISEHLNFNAAYLIGSIAIITITAVYTRAISGTMKLTLFMTSFLAGLYGFLYVIIQLEDFSLLIGSAGLFAILASVMIFTRKIDWYSFKLDRGTD